MKSVYFSTHLKPLLKIHSVSDIRDYECVFIALCYVDGVNKYTKLYHAVDIYSTFSPLIRKEVLGVRA